MQAFAGEPEIHIVETVRQSFENANDPNLLAAEALLTELASVFFPGDSAALSSTHRSVPGEDPKIVVNQETRNLEAGYRTLVEQIQAVVFMAYLDKSIGEAYVSPQIETMLGFSQEEWLNDPVRWYNQIHP
jgi:hypothetical protein